MNELPFRKLRYWMFRLSTEDRGGNLADGIPDGIREKYEALTEFAFAGGWSTFGIKWDINEDRDIVVLEKSLLAAWDEYCLSVAKELPIKKGKKVPKKKKRELENLEYDVQVSKGGGVRVNKRNV